jgi:hypothetical protein
VRPCPECGGSGIVHCCEGERPDQCPEHSEGATLECISRLNHVRRNSSGSLAIFAAIRRAIS